MTRITLIIAVIVAMSLVDLAIMARVRDTEWANYKATFQKTYSNIVKEKAGKWNYGNNRNSVNRINKLYDSGNITYKLAINHLSDLESTYVTYMQFPLTIPSSKSNAMAAPAVQPAAFSYDPRDMGFKLNIENQGTKCNSGWAYAAAKSIELFKAAKAGNKNPSSLSAQNLIDCAGRLNACYNQRPQAAFDYLTQSKMNLYLEKDYKNNNSSNQQGMCTTPTIPQQLQVTTLTAYCEIRNGSDESLKSYVSAGMPVVVEVNPGSFEFIHYSEGIFSPPLKSKGSHFMVLVGYGTDKKTNLDYWLLLNSFGTTWGEGGLMKWSRTSNSRITKYAIFPCE